MWKADKVLIGEEYSWGLFDETSGEHISFECIFEHSEFLRTC
jgi:hypothetical protein